MPLSILLLVGVLISTSAPATAHDANVATIKIIRQPSDSYVFELQTPLQALDKAMREGDKERSSELDDDDQSSVEYKELIIDYVKSNFDLEENVTASEQVDSSGASLGQGLIKLGEHISVLLFEIKNMPDVKTPFKLRLPYMDTSNGQVNFVWLIDGDRKQNLTLSARNSFTANDIDFFTAHSE